MGFKDCDPLLLRCESRYAGLLKSRRQCRGGLGFDLEEMIQTKALKKREIAGVGSHNAEQPAFQIAEAEGHGSQGAHESRVHEFALFEIQNKLIVAL